MSPPRRSRAPRAARRPRPMTLRSSSIALDALVAVDRDGGGRKRRTMRRGVPVAGRVRVPLDRLDVHAVGLVAELLEPARAERRRARPRRGRRRRRRPPSSPSSSTSGFVNAACAGPRRPMISTSRTDDARKASSAWSATSVTRSSSSESTSIRATSIATLPLPITATRSAERSNSRSRVVGVAVVPGDELRGGVRAAQFLAGDAHVAVGRARRSRRSPRRSARQLVRRDRRADLDVAEEAKARLRPRSCRTSASRP